MDSYHAIIDASLMAITMTQAELQRQLNEAEKRGRTAAAGIGAHTSASSNDIDAARAAGVTEERSRLAAIDENTIPGYETLAAACKADGTSVAKFVSAQLALMQHEPGVAALRPAVGAGTAAQAAGRLYSVTELQNQIKKAAGEGRRIGSAEAFSELQFEASSLSPERYREQAVAERQQRIDATDEQRKRSATNATLVAMHKAEAKAHGRNIDTYQAMVELEQLGKITRW